MWFKVILDEPSRENKASSSVGLLTTRFLVGFSVFSSCLKQRVWFTASHLVANFGFQFSHYRFSENVLENNGVDAQHLDRSGMCSSQGDCSLEKMDTCTMHTCIDEYLKMILSYSSNAPLIYSLHVVYLASFYGLGLIFCMKFQCLYLLLLLSLVQKRRISE